MSMTTLKCYVAKKTKRKPSAAVTQPAPVVLEIKAGARNRARELYHQYVALQRQHAKWVVSYEGDQRLRTCFCKLALKFETLEKSGAPIDVGVYMAAHKEHFGKELRPHHLLGQYSMPLYEAALEAKYAEPVILTPEQKQRYNDTVVADLALTHDEAPETIAALLESVGLL